MANQHLNAAIRAPLAGLLAWILPGLGHIFLGYRIRGIILLVTVTATFWTGVAIGSVQATVDPQERKLWFAAQICSGGNTLAAYTLAEVAEAEAEASGITPAPAHWRSADVGVHYTGVAGLMNLLIILDAISRADPSSVRRRGSAKVPKGGP